MIGHPALREIIGADTFTSISCAYLTFPVFGNFVMLILLHFIKKAGSQYFHCLCFIFVLRLFILTRHNKTCRQVG